MRDTCCILFFLFFIVSCKPEKNTHSDTPYEGEIHICVEESFREVIEEQITMYQETYPNTRIIPSFGSEEECFHDLLKDSSIRLVVIGRGLAPNEEQYFKDSLNYSPGWQKVASDAIVIIVNAESTDTLFTQQRLRDQLAGKINRGQEIVFDGLSATSTVRFVKDSILKGGSFDTSVVKAARNSQGVIDYVADHKEAVGFVGFNWIGNPQDTSQVNLLKKVKMGWVQCDQCEGKPFVKPMQESIMTNRYPLVRGLFYINRENYQGLGSGFSSFLKNEKGQLIFRRAYLWPVMDFNIRRININLK